MEARTGHGKIVTNTGRKVPTAPEASPASRKKPALNVMPMTQSKGMELESL